MSLAATINENVFIILRLKTHSIARESRKWISVAIHIPFHTSFPPVQNSHSSNKNATMFYSSQMRIGDVTRKAKAFRNLGLRSFEKVHYDFSMMNAPDF